MTAAMGGVFAQRAHGANYCVACPGNTPANHPPTEAGMINSKQHRGCRIQDPGTRGKHQTKKTNPQCTSRGCGVQNAGHRPVATGGGKQPTFRTARAQRAHRARCAPHQEASRTEQKPPRSPWGLLATINKNSGRQFLCLQLRFSQVLWAVWVVASWDGAPVLDPLSLPRCARAATTPSKWDSAPEAWAQ